MKLGETNQIEPSACLNCGTKNDAATPIGDDVAQPRCGDVAMCLYCGHLMAYDKNAKLRPLTAMEVIEIAGDPRVVAASNALAATRGKLN